MAQKWLWLLPFVFFFSGYLITSRAVRVHETEVPSLLGLSLQEGLIALTAAQLYGHIIGEQHTSDLTPGTIIDQTPAPGSTIKARQTVGLLITQAPLACKAPLVMGKKRHDIEALVKKEGIRLKEYWVEHTTPLDYCVAQYPAANTPLDGGNLTLYYSKGATSTRVVPDLRGLPVKKAQEALALASIFPLVVHANVPPPGHSCAPLCSVSEQKPLAGTLLTIDSKISIHLLIAHSFLSP